MDHVLGYTCMNDVTDREAQVSDGQWVRSKSYDTFGPVGPRVVPASDIPDPQNLSVRCWLNGELLQDGHTSDMIFGVAELIAYVSDTVTLDPGDIITTGTPAGVGAFRAVPIFLKPGDEVTVEIEGIGRLTNPVIAGR
jgi:2-keto-4-pentenoate hydratase/2-oxohepta-3-ene-1,7-dioic acid hydratase in catechol pathway